MRSFLSKRKDREDYDEVEETVVKRIPKTKTFKDLKSQNKKKRKEPPKPWGKFERILVFAVILLTAGTSAVLALSARAWKLPGLPRLTLPKISLKLPFLGEETIVFEGENASVADKKKADSVIETFLQKTENLSGVWGLYVVNLSNGYSYGVNEDEVFEAASLIKLPVIAAMYKESELGNIDLSEIYKLKNSDKLSGSGSLYSKPQGYEITYQNLLDLMGKQSDNTAFNVCRKLLGDEKVAGTIKSIGMEKTNLADNETSPKDIGMFFSNLFSGNIVGSENKDKILDSLTDTLYENWLAAGIPENIQIAHKFGRETHVVNDAGVVFSNKPYVVVILSKGVVERDADEIFPVISKAIYDIQAGL